MVVLLTPAQLLAQAEALAGLAGNATELNFYGTQVSAANGDLKAERSGGARGLGFELSFEVPGGITRRVKGHQPAAAPKLETDCESRVERGLPDKAECSDTTVKSVKRTKTISGVQYEEELEITDFEWEEEIVSFEFAVGFSQTGAFVSRHADSDLRVSIREIPSVSLYANFAPPLPAIGDLVGVYFGMRSGIISLVGGRSYSANGLRKFGGETFQLGPVVGLVTELAGLNLFAEGSYMWRDLKSIDWDGDAALGSLPRRVNLSGAALAVGIQFQFKDPDKK
jgi:hypothetical protein